jgi:hypothetical protein
MPRFHRRPQFQAKAKVPMTTESRDRLAIEIRMAGETLIAQPSIDAYNTVSKMFAMLVRAGMAGEIVDPGSRIMGAICDRYEQVRTITVEPEEAAALRQVIANIDGALPRIPLNRFDRAVAEVEAFFALTNMNQSDES